VAAQVLALFNLAAVPFRDTVETIVKRAFAPLVDSGDLKIDLSDTPAASADHRLTFTATYDWDDYSRRGCFFRPLYYGVTGEVLLEAIERRNFCANVTRCDSCERVFRRSADEQGKMIGVTAIHEIGHMLGLMGKAAFPGANSEGHSGDPANGMFAINMHKDFNPIEMGGPRTRKYTIVSGDTLSGIAHRIGFWPAGTYGWKFLYDLKGKDGTQNKTLLKSGNPHKIWPGEQIWVPDPEAWVAFNRIAFLKDKTFSAEQVTTMRKFLKSGGNIIQLPAVPQRAPAPTP
jgi:hypothetical protein